MTELSRPGLVSRIFGNCRPPRRRGRRRKEVSTTSYSFRLRPEEDEASKATIDSVHIILQPIHTEVGAIRPQSTTFLWT